MRGRSPQERAREKRAEAAELRLIAASLSAHEDRELMARHAAELEADAALLEAEAERRQARPGPCWRARTAPKLGEKFRHLGRKGGPAGTLIVGRVVRRG